MSQFFEFFATYIAAAIALEIAMIGFIVWAYFHEEELVRFEDALIRLIRRSFRRWKFRAKRKVINKIRDIYLFVYLPYRRIKRKLLRRLLRQFGLKAVRCEQENSYEILSRR